MRSAQMLQMRGVVFNSISQGDKMKLAACMEDYEVADLICSMSEKARTNFLEDLVLEDNALAESAKDAIWWAIMYQVFIYRYL